MLDGREVGVLPARVELKHQFPADSNPHLLKLLRSEQAVAVDGPESLEQFGLCEEGQEAGRVGGVGSFLQPVGDPLFDV